MQKEALAITSKDAGRALTDGFDKYRTFVSDDYYQEMTFTK
jgi:hypothetical protein